MGCASPAPLEDAPRRQTILATEYDDARAGEEAVREVLSEIGLVEDEALQAYVQSLGEQLLRHASRRPFAWRFQLIDEWTPNAFALPGGYVFVSRGLLALTNSEDELASVIAHEIVHATARHAAARQVVIGGIHPFALGPVRAARIAAYAREQERSADQGGQQLAAAAGFDPAGISTFLESLRNAERLRTGSERLPSYLDTHPGLTERIAATSARAQNLRWSRGPGVAGAREEYLRRLDGLVLGENPAEGVLRGSRFLHPELDFAVNFPSGWRIENTHRAVVAFSPKGDARFTLELAARGDDPQVPAQIFLAQQGPRLGAVVEEAQLVDIGCCRAYVVRGHANSPSGRVSGQMTWVAYRGLIYRLSATALSFVAESYFGRARALARSFRPLAPEERASLQVDRLRLVRARAGETLAALIERSGSSWDVQRTAVGNRLLPTAQLEAGHLVKIARREPYVPRSDASAG